MRGAGVGAAPEPWSGHQCVPAAPVQHGHGSPQSSGPPCVPAAPVLRAWGSPGQRRSDRGTAGPSALGEAGDAIVLQKAVSNKEEEPLVPLMDGVGSRTNGCK